MKLQTQIPLSPAKTKIDYHSQLVLMGSCFVRNMGKKLDYFKFQNLQNPLGILFHPTAIENLISRAIDQVVFTDRDVFFHNDRWYCFAAHSDLSKVSREKLILELNQGLKRMEMQLEKSTHIIFTLGTAWVYRHRKTNTLVANCHKIPQKEFDKELLAIEAIVKNLESVMNHIRSTNKKAQVIFTVSPVRHLKDGFVENQRSKAHLIAGIHKWLETSSLATQSSYFPAYELMMDELRDYRFYETDMIHLNPLAIDYIWEKFMQTWIREEAFSTMGKVDIIQKGLTHRPFYPDSESHQKFEKSLREKITYLQKGYPFMEF
ncbi:GSCFA domain-containing protein [Ulvibacterium sp.]|uniref:GSCFA domain-containing protein n=1 Tax=Ulvibacterium sp. TaxID=2665914 RepID=UPI0026161E3A|nr:GSCFA domain-containing protein [Ulvibacterium sp.]